MAPGYAYLCGPIWGSQWVFGEEVLFFNNVADLRVRAVIITFSRGILSRRLLRSRSESYRTDRP